MRIQIGNMDQPTYQISKEDFETFLTVGIELAKAADERLNTVYARVSVERDGEVRVWDGGAFVFQTFDTATFADWLNGSADDDDDDDDDDNDWTIMTYAERVDAAIQEAGGRLCREGNNCSICDELRIKYHL